MTKVGPDQDAIGRADSTTDAVEMWRRARAEELDGVDPAVLTREQRMDLDRRAQVLDRVDEVVAESLARPRVDGPVDGTRRVVLAHRQEWFGRRLSDELARRGVDVLAVVSDGADAVGKAIAEQPDLVLVEAVLARMSGYEVLRDIRRFAPGTVCVAQVAYGDGVVAMTQAGARAAWTRKATPVQVADDIAALLDA